MNYTARIVTHIWKRIPLAFIKNIVLKNKQKELFLFKKRGKNIEENIYFILESC
jgi:hypothetical protein